MSKEEQKVLKTMTKDEIIEILKEYNYQPPSNKQPALKNFADLLEPEHTKKLFESGRDIILMMVEIGNKL